MQRSGTGTVQWASVRTLDLAGFTELRRLSRNRIHDFHPAFAAVAIDSGNVGTVAAAPAVDFLAAADFVGLVTPTASDKKSGHQATSAFSDI